MRPALIISNTIINRTGDYLLRQLTTRITKDNLSLQIAPTDFAGRPLLREGELRLHKVFTLKELLMEGVITSVSWQFMNIVVEKLSALIK